MRDFAKELRNCTLPALHLVASEDPTKSYLGGDPLLPSDFPWPLRDGRRLDFIARISLFEANGQGGIPELPSEGALLFFYDAERQPHGSDPEDYGGFSVLLVPDLPTPLDPAQLAAEDATCQGVRAVPMHSYPSWEHETVVSLNLTDQEADDYEDFVDSMHGQHPKHQVGGHPSPIQGEGMQLLCQLASSGHFCGHGDWSNLDAVLPEMKQAAESWRLVLQIDTDESIEFQWGDAGTIYFWAPLGDDGKLQVHRAWVALQCS